MSDHKSAQRQKTGRRSNRKGKRGERQAAAAVSAALGVDGRRGVQYQGGPGSPDIRMDLSGVHWEVKRVERLQLYPAIEQATADAGDDVPVVLHRRNGRQWVVIVPLDRLIDLADAISGRENYQLGRLF